MISLRKFEKDDISLLVKWFHMEHVREYWYSILNYTDEMIKDKYIKRLYKGGIDLFIFQKNNQDIGYLQTYIVENLEPYKVEGLSKGIDLFIGDEKFLGKGIGPKVVKIFINNYIFDDENILNVCIDPEVRNTRAIRAYEKVGFKHSNTAYCNTSKLLTYYMVLERQDFFVNS